ncbi:hypothetical protein WN48_08993 [Eufriesea mexicana]|uniref:Uncharacterized protein n=2 Tax=Eufriesea mexicana TaxID=516756 RepID=A0A310SNZ8_9HYME|nr:hypothetical protein WN48_08993 [Eufriesea mexicana]
MEALLLNNEIVAPEKKFESQSEIVLPQSRRRVSPILDPFTLSFIIRQLLASNHRPYQPDVELNKE